MTMPPSSRKRNKGKERKAKQQAKKEENERTTIHKFWRRYYVSNQCKHGCNVIISDDHPVSNFMDQFIMNLKNMVVSEVSVLFTTHPHILNNESYRKLAIGILLHIGTNILLHEGSPLSWPACIAQSIVVLEHYDGTDDIDSVINSRVVRSKWRELNTLVCSGRRDCLKFYRKRTSCKCLKKMHLEARKNEPKTGICWYCKTEKERVALSLCSRCMVGQYCSRECQVADWPVHEEDCDDCVRVHKQQTARCRDR